MKAKPYQIDALTPQIQKTFRAALVFGPDLSVVQDTAEKIALKIVPSLSDDFNVIKVTPAQLKENISFLSDEGNALSFMGGRKLLWVKETDANTVEALSLFLNQIKTDSFVLITAGNLQKSSTLRSFSETSGDVLTLACYPDSEQEIKRQIISFFTENQITAPLPVIDLIQSKVNENRYQIKSELEKLKTYLGNQTQVSIQDVDAVLSDVSNSTIDTFCLSVASGYFQKADKACQTLLQAGETPVSLIRYLMLYFNNLLLGLDLMDKNQNIFLILKQILKPNQFALEDQVKSQLSFWNKETVMRVLSLLLENEKNTKTSGFIPELMLSKTILMIITAAQKNKRPI